MKNIFTTVKAAVTTKQAAEYYGLRVSRNGMTCCPFHEDRNPSMKVDERYYCFGCHETGDVIDFTAKLFGLTPYEAAKKLAWDFHIDPNTPQPPVAAAMKKQAVQQEQTPCGFATRLALTDNREESMRKHSAGHAKQSQDETFCMRALVDCEATLRNWKEQYAPSSPDDPWDDRFVEACNMLDYVSAMVDILFMPDAEMRKMLVQQMKEENTIQCLKDRLEALREEDEHGETEMGAA